MIKYLIEEPQEYTDRYKDFVIIQGNYRRAIDPYFFNAINENLKQERFFPFPMNENILKEGMIGEVVYSHKDYTEEKFYPLMPHWMIEFIFKSKNNKPYIKVLGQIDSESKIIFPYSIILQYTDVNIQAFNLFNRFNNKVAKLSRKK